MDLTGQTELKIQNRIFTLGSPVTHTNTLDQLLHIFQQQGIQERPIVVINPVDESVPDLTNLLENYIANAMQGSRTTQHTSYMFQDASDADIEAWAKVQYKPDGSQTLDYLIETGKVIRDQSKLKVEIDKANNRRAELWQQHCLNPESDTGSDEYAYITYTLIPRLEASLKETTQRLNSIPKDLANKPADTPVENHVEAVECEIEAVENPVEVVETQSVSEGDMVGTGKPDSVWFTPSKLLMPLAMAQQLADSPQNQIYKAQQDKIIPGYQPVPLVYLIALGVRLYPDGVPIVFTKSGRFRRIGDCDNAPISNSYWYPTPRYQ